MSKKQNQSIIRKMISITIVALILGAVCFLGGVLLAHTVPGERCRDGLCYLVAYESERKPGL